MPSITEFLTLQAAYEVLPVAIGSISSKYDEKFRILQSQADFLPRLCAVGERDGVRLKTFRYRGVPPC